MSRVVWSSQAVQDLENIKRYIARDSEKYARLVVERLLGVVERLAEFPDSGRVVPEVGVVHTREVLWRNYRIVYRVRDDVVEVVMVLHGARPLQRGKWGPHLSEPNSATFPAVPRAQSPAPPALR